MTIKNIFIVAAAIFSLQLAASVAPENKFNQERYDSLSGAFDEKINNFRIYNFAPGLIDSDIETIKEHKEANQIKLSNHKLTLETSWKPLIFKLLGGIFAIPTLSSALFLEQSLGYAFQLPDWIPSIKTYPGQANPMAMGGNIFTGSLGQKLKSMYFDQKNISLFQFSSAFSAINLVHTLFFGSITFYLLKKAMSYANEIKEMEKIIARDEKMIEVLQAIKNQTNKSQIFFTT